MNLPRLYCPIFLWNNYNRLTLQFNLFSLRLLNIFTLCKIRCPFSYLKSSQYKTFNIFLIFIIFIKALAAWRVNKQYFGILIFFFFFFFFFFFDGVSLSLMLPKRVSEKDVHQQLCHLNLKLSLKRCINIALIRLLDVNHWCSFH